MVPCLSYQKAGNDLINQFFTIILPKVYFMRQNWSKDLSVGYFDLPSQKPQLLSRVWVCWGTEKSWPLPLPFTPKGLQTLAHCYQGQLSWSGNGVPGQEDDESGGTEKEAWVFTIILHIYCKEGKFQWTWVVSNIFFLLLMHHGAEYP